MRRCNLIYRVRLQTHSQDAIKTIRMAMKRIRSDAPSIVVQSIFEVGSDRRWYKCTQRLCAVCMDFAILRDRHESELDRGCFGSWQGNIRQVREIEIHADKPESVTERATCGRLFEPQEFRFTQFAVNQAVFSMQRLGDCTNFGVCLVRYSR